MEYRRLIGIIFSDFKSDAIKKNDGNIFFRALKEYGLAPFAYTRFMHLETKQIPEDFCQRLKSEYLHNFGLHEFQKKKALELIRMFNKAGVSCIILKSPFLNDRIYDDVVRIAGSDIDILIKHENFNKVNEILESLGYKTEDEYTPPRYKFDYQLLYDNPQNGAFSVDIHFKACGGALTPDLPVSVYWEGSKRTKIEETSVLAFSDEDLFVYLCILAYIENDLDKRSRYLLDLFYFLRKYENTLDYIYLSRIINKYKLNFYVLICIRFLKDIFGSRVNINTRFQQDIKIFPPRLKIVEYALKSCLQKGEKKSNNLCCEIWYKYLYRTAYSGGCFLGVLRQMYLIYKFSYLMFKYNNGLHGGITTFFKHILYVFNK